MKKILFFYNKLSSTFWFIPVVIIIIALILAVTLVVLDQEVSISQNGFGKYFFVNSADSGRSILSTISGAMIGVAGTVFSVTLVALTLASSQFGPRLIKNFMHVKLNQVVLGSYVATYLYCLFILNAVKENDNYTFIPVISILVAIVAALINIVLLILFIHQIAMSIQADQIISDVSGIIYKQSDNLYPSQMGNDLASEKIKIVEAIKSKYLHTIQLKSPKNGYFQYIDSESLIELISSYDALLELHNRPGDYLVKNLEIGILYCNEKPTEKQLNKIYNQFVFGRDKSYNQDIEFSIHQMVEIASRALSPGVNDPFTAITCIDNLTAIVCLFTEINFPSSYRVDQQEQLRVIANTTSFEGILDASFNQIRQFSAGNPSVIIRLMEGLITINKLAHRDNQIKAIRKHAKMVLNSGKESIKEELDFLDLEERSKKILAN